MNKVYLLALIIMQMGVGILGTYVFVTTILRGEEFPNVFYAFAMSFIAFSIGIDNIRKLRKTKSNVRQRVM